MVGAGLIGPAVAMYSPAKADAGRDDEREYLSMKEVILASLLGLATTSSAMIGVALGPYIQTPARLHSRLCFGRTDKRARD